MKLLEEIIGERLQDIGIGKDFFFFFGQAQEIKNKSKQMGFHGTKKLFYTK
jgi:hypothetical protein